MKVLLEIVVPVKMVEGVSPMVIELFKTLGDIRALCFDRF